MSKTDPVLLLRESTSAWHQKVEEIPTLKRLLDPNVSQDDYINALRLLHQFHATLEPHFEYTEFFPEGLPYQRRLSLLEMDLEKFGVKPIFFNHQFSLSTKAEAWGCRYVLDGSRLGGQVIASHLIKCTSWATRDRLNFFSGHPEQGKKWSAFLEEARTCLQDAESLDVAIKKACETFALLCNIAQKN